MAKFGEGAPYMLDAINAPNDSALIDAANAALSAVAADLDALINKYHRADWPYVAAAMELTASSLKSHLDRLDLATAEALVDCCVSTSTVISDLSPGDRSLGGMKGGG